MESKRAIYIYITKHERGTGTLIFFFTKKKSAAIFNTRINRQATVLDERKLSVGLGHIGDVISNPGNTMTCAMKPNNHLGLSTAQPFVKAASSLFSRDKVPWGYQRIESYDHLVDYRIFPALFRFRSDRTTGTARLQKLLSSRTGKPFLPPPDRSRQVVASCA